MSAFVGGGVGIRRVQGRALNCRRQRKSAVMVFAAANKAPKSNPYTTFGITEDSSYDELEEAYRGLMSKHSNDPKMMMQLELTKEQIVADKLQKSQISPRGFFGTPAAAPALGLGSNPYRMFGITEDADYEEVEEAYRRTVLRYADDPTMMMKVEMTKEAILADRVQKRGNGAVATPAPAPAMSGAPAPAVPSAAAAPSGDMIKMPEGAYMTRVTLLLGFLLGMLFLIPKLSTSFMAIAGMCAMGFLYNRGLPDGDTGRPGAVKPVENNIVMKTVGLICFFGGLGLGLGKFILAKATLPSWLPQACVVPATVILGFWLSCTFFQVRETAPARA